MQFAAIVLCSMLGAIVYGILHDLVTAQVCVEYFTIGHPVVFHTGSPILLALGWGVIASWWVGLPLGVALAAAARLGPDPKRGMGSLWRPMAKLFGVVALCALTAGVMGWVLASSGAIALHGGFETAVPVQKHVAFLADAWAHGASYFAGIIGGAIFVTRVWQSRKRA
jgi:hypothetical protein